MVCKRFLNIVFNVVSFIPLSKTLPPIFYLHAMTRLAYLPTLADNKRALVKYITVIDASKYASHIIYLLSIFVLSSAFDLSYVETAIFSIAVTTLVSSLLMHKAWTKISDVPSLQQKPKDENFVVSGFKKLAKTYREVKERNKPLKWILLTYAISNPVFASVFFVGPTFGKEFLNFSPSQSALAMIMVSIASIPGALFSKRISAKTNLLATLRLFLLMIFLCGIFCVIFVTGPDAKAAGYIFYGFLGLCCGGYYVTETALYCLLVPSVKESELTGVYVSFIRILVWFPPVLFTVLNENGLGTS